MKAPLAALAALSLSTVIWGTGVVQGAIITGPEWGAYKEHFVDPSGRIVDTGNGGISHSEGQGYGLMLAYLAGRPDDFERIWTFTRTEMLLRDDGLSVWKWVPGARIHTPDLNNATDGDLLIAYALWRAGKEWHRPDYLALGRTIAAAIAQHCVVKWKGRSYLLPGVKGFSAEDRQEAGPVVNPSYWVFSALPAMNELMPSPIWASLGDSGVTLIDEAQFGRRRLPSDWVSLGADRDFMASGFPTEFGYNSLRIPLYLVAGDVTDPERLKRLQAAMTAEDGNPAIFDLARDTVKVSLGEPGYRMMLDLAACAIDGSPLSAASRSFTPTLYYPSTLQLLGLAVVREKYPKCL